ncbi:MAG: phage portal protein [Pseudomonadota bacterium]
MSIFNRLFQRARSVTPRHTRAEAGTLISSPDELADYIRNGKETASGVQVTPERAMTLSSVNRAVSIVSGVVATVPVELKRRTSGRVETVDDGTLSVLLSRRPNRWMKRSVFFRMMNSHMMLRGAGYAMKVRGIEGGRRVVKELVPMHPDRVEPKQLPDLTIVFEYTRPNGSKVVLPASEVLHVMISTFDGVKGVSPIHYAREAIGAGLGVEKHGASMWKNGTNIGSVLHTESTLDNDQVDRLRESLEKFRGAENAFKTLVLEAGLKWEPVGMTASDAQFLENRKFSRTDIAMFFGVPPHMLGDADASDGSGKNLEERSRSFVLYTLEDYFTAWEDAINADLIEDDSVFAQFKRTALIRGDITARAKWYQGGLQWGWLSPDEVRAEEGMNPRPDGKGSEFYPPPNMTKTEGTGANRDGNENEEDRDNDASETS